MKTGAIIQARMKSTRLPGKVMMDICGKPVLQHVINRVCKARLVDCGIIATTPNSGEIIEFCKGNISNIFIGSEENVMERVLQAAIHFELDYIIEITADCPCIDPELIDQCIAITHNNPLIDYVSNCVPHRTYPDGLDVQVYKTEALQKCFKMIDEIPKHVGYNIGIDKFNFTNVCLSAPWYLFWPELRITLDTAEDLELIKTIFNRFKGQPTGFNTYDIVHFLKGNRDLLDLNKNISAKKPEEG